MASFMLFALAKPPTKDSRSELDQRLYRSGIKVSDAELAQVQVQRDKFHGDWNYQIIPRKTHP
jgi:hypothetical protein